MTKEKHKAILIENGKYILAWDIRCKICHQIGGHKPTRELTEEEIPAMTQQNKPMNTQNSFLEEKLEEFEEMCVQDKEYGNELQKPVVRQKVKIFWLKVLQEFAEKIRLEKKNHKERGLMLPQVTDEEEGYNQAIDDLEALIAELLKGKSSK